MDSLRRTSRPTVSPEAKGHAPCLPQATPPAFKRTEELPYRAPLTPQFPKAQPLPKKKWGWLGIASLGIFVCLLAALGFLVWKGVSTAEKIQVTGSTAAAPTLTQKLKTLRAALTPGEQVPLRGEERGRINVLLLGKAGEGMPGENLTDTIMMASVDTRTKKVALLSLPRDLYVQDQKNNLSGKINTFYQKGMSEGEGLEPIKDAVTLITGEPVDYFFVMDFAGFESVVDALNGISVDVPKDFYDPRYPGKNYSYETFQLSKGWQRLDGSTALKYVRERHDDPEGDFGRAKRQQQVLQAIKNKAFSPGTYFNFLRINKLFESVAENVETDATLPEMQSFYELSKTLDTHNITNQVVDAWKPESLLRVDHQILGGTRAFVLVPRTGTWEETRDLAKNIFEQEALASKKRALEAENASVLILDSGNTLQSAKKLSQYIERELGMEASVLYSPALEQDSYPAMLLTRGSLTKPHSFEELLKRLPLSRGDAIPSLPSTAKETDFILIMDENLAEIFQNADEYYNQDTLSIEEEFLD